MIKLSVAIITLNEEKHIGRCIDSVKEIADEILIVDSFSTDGTQKIVESKHAKFIQNKFEGYKQQKNFALEKVSYNYVLSLDADEALDKTAVESVCQVKANWDYDSYTLNRLACYCGKWIRHCGWHPDKKIRIIDRRKAKWGGVNLHEKMVLSKQATNLRIGGNILHYTCSSISSHVLTINNYSEIAAREMGKNEKKVNFLIHILLNPPFTFIKQYFFQLGFLDGFYGFVICVLSALSKYLKYTKIWQLRRERSSS